MLNPYRTTANNDYGVSSSSESERCLKKEHMEASNSMLTDKQMKNMDVSNAMLSPILYTPAVQVLTLEPVVTVSSRPVRQNRGMKMKTFLTVASKNEQSKSGLRGLSTSKTCPTCGKTYTRASDMRRHQRSHTGERPYQCSLCKKLFQFQYDLKRHEHERFHTGDLPFKCPKCPKAFSYASALKLHDRTHTKEAPFLCWDCGKGCKSNAALRIHRDRFKFHNDHFI
uniref:C2H2-type domain-containing protein n=1 Tax=Myripristis murdjan TaxID=586833 RepID=A0A668AL08_9TELE